MLFVITYVSRVILCLPPMLVQAFQFLFDVQMNDEIIASQRFFFCILSILDSLSKFFAANFCSVSVSLSFERAFHDVNKFKYAIATTLSLRWQWKRYRVCRIPCSHAYLLLLYTIFIINEIKNTVIIKSFWRIVNCELREKDIWLRWLDVKYLYAVSYYFIRFFSCCIRVCVYVAIQPHCCLVWCEQVINKETSRKMSKSLFFEERLPGVLCVVWRLLLQIIAVIVIIHLFLLKNIHIISLCVCNLIPEMKTALYEHHIWYSIQSNDTSYRNIWSNIFSIHAMQKQFII